MSYELPTFLEVMREGQSEPIQYNVRDDGDYRMSLECLSCLQDTELPQNERLIAALMIFYEDFNELIDVLQIDDLEPFVKFMFYFLDCGESNSEFNKSLPYKLVDWDADSNIICAAVNKASGCEVRSVEYMHWWTFMGWYMSIGESVFSTVVHIRSKIKKQQKLEKHERQFRAENPKYFMWDSRTMQQKEDDELLNRLWNSDKK